MPESETDLIDYYPSGWTEEVFDESYIEWRYNADPTIFVRLEATSNEETYAVTPVTGVNSSGDEFVTRPMSQVSRETAFEVAQTLIYAMNGTAGRLKEESEFTGDK